MNSKKGVLIGHCAEKCQVVADGRESSARAYRAGRDAASKGSIANLVSRGCGSFCGFCTSCGGVGGIRRQIWQNWFCVAACEVDATVSWEIAFEF